MGNDGRSDPSGPLCAGCRHSQGGAWLGWHPLFLTVSFVGTEGLIRAAGPDAEGVGIESIHNFDAGLGRDFRLDYGPKDHKGFDS